MDLESECSVLESVDGNEQITKNSVLKKLGCTSESKVQNNGSGVVEENNDNNELFPEVKHLETEVSGYVNSPSVKLEPEASSSPPMTRKGYGLKKWRRIKRDPNKFGDCTIDTGKMITQDLSNSGANSNSSKRIQYAERKQKSEGSVSSTNAMVRSMHGFALLDDLGLGLGSSFAAGTDSENSEDHSSKSSTAASAPMIKYEIPVIMGFPLDKTKMRSLSGKNLMHSVHRGQQGKGRVETTKKARGDRVKIEKENSHSSVESDSRSSNFVFMQGTYSTNNGIQNERRKEYDGENCDEVQGIEQLVSDGHQDGYHRDGERGFGGLSPEVVDAGSSWEVKEVRSDNHGSSRDQDLLVESVFALQYAQEALEKEVLKLKEISKESSTDDSLSDLSTEFIDEEKLQKRISEGIPHGEGLRHSGAMQSEVIERANRDEETELEDLFKQKVEAEVEYLAISRTVQKLRVAAVDQITVFEDEKALASEQAQILNKLGDAENKASMLKKEAEKLEIFCEDIVSAAETMKLQKKVYKYSSCFLLQLLLLIVIVGVLVSQSSPNYVEVVPT